MITLVQIYHKVNLIFLNINFKSKFLGKSHYYITSIKALINADNNRLQMLIVV